MALSIRSAIAAELKASLMWRKLALLAGSAIRNMLYYVGVSASKASDDRVVVVSDVWRLTHLRGLGT